jgi:hypothetical protein
MLVQCAWAARRKKDHDPLFRFHRWLANLRMLEVEEIKSVPYAPISHPFVERLTAGRRSVPTSISISISPERRTCEHTATTSRSRRNCRCATSKPFATRAMARKA